MKLTREQLPELAKRTEKFIAGHPQGVCLKEDVLMMGSGDETAYVLTLDELTGNGTTCGGLNNTCFTGKIIEFLESQGVEHVLVGVFHDWDDENNLVIVGGAVPIPYEGECKDWKKWYSDEHLTEMEEDGESDPSPSAVLSYLVSEVGDGSWRDDCCIEGWSTYESE